MPETRATASAAEPRLEARAAASEARPLTAPEFAALMADIGLEGPPAGGVAVAVSGGADSLALALLAAEWAHARGGACRAFTVDHGLRPESAAEAKRVAVWLADGRIPHTTLNPEPALTPGASAAAARIVRYRALRAACRAHGIAHLLLAHHLQDQAETVLMRVTRGTGLAGAAGMAPLDRWDGIALCRPLLQTDRSRLRTFLVSSGQAWVEDPSNDDPAFERVRVRRFLANTRDGTAPARWAASVAAPALARLETELAAIARETVRLHPEGFAVIERDRLRREPDVLARHLLNRLLTTVSGNVYPPRSRALAGAFASLRDGRRATAHGCLLRPGRDGAFLIVREPAAIAPATTVGALPTRRWDGRFAIAPDVPEDWEILAPGAAGWRKAAVDAVTTGGGLRDDLPGIVRAGLPVFRHSGRVVEVPFSALGVPELLRFAPRNPLIREGLRVALPDAGLI